MDQKKRCTCCRRLKSVDDFSANAQNPDGLAYYCRKCNAAKQRAWKQANPKKVKAWKADYLERRRAEKADWK